MKCKKCQKELRVLTIIVLEENEYTVYPVRMSEETVLLQWTNNGANEGSANYYDLCCPFCEILIERMYDIEKVKEYMNTHFKPLSDYNNTPVEVRGSI